MYSVPQDFDFTICLGTPLDQVRLGQFDVQFVFSSGVRIAVQDEIALEQADHVVAHWLPGTGWTSVALQALIGLSMIEADRLADGGLGLVFSDKSRLKLLATASQFESCQVYGPAAACPSLIV